jgi:hypothetical protein
MHDSCQQQMYEAPRNGNGYFCFAPGGLSHYRGAMSVAELYELDQLIDMVSPPVNNQCELLREHLERAGRTYSDR